MAVKRAYSIRQTSTSLAHLSSDDLFIIVVSTAIIIVIIVVTNILPLPTCLATTFITNFNEKVRNTSTSLAHLSSNDLFIFVITNIFEK